MLHLAIQVKVALATTVLFVAQTTTAGNGFLSGNVFDAGTTIAALALLAYILRQLLGGDLVSKSTIQSVVESSVRETLREIDRG